jgi:hypothetical protein
MTAAETLAKLDADAVKLIGPSPSDAEPGDAVKRLVAVEIQNQFLVRQLMNVNQMDIPGSGAE